MLDGGVPATVPALMTPSRASAGPAPLLAVLLAVAAAFASGCTPDIGDNCSTSIDCSATGERICDTAQPDGYCTIRGCEEGTCPPEGVCVEFRPDSDRLADRWCMLKCASDGDCRDGYRCLHAQSSFSRIVAADEGLLYCGVP